jgi:hypothetical protein
MHGLPLFSAPHYPSHMLSSGIVANNHARGAIAVTDIENVFEWVPYRSKMSVLASCVSRNRSTTRLQVARPIPLPRNIWTMEAFERFEDSDRLFGAKPLAIIADRDAPMTTLLQRASI